MSSFRSTARPPFPRQIGPYDKWLVDPTTGAPVGILNPNAGGKDGYFAPIMLTVSQIENPSDEILAMTDVQFQLNVAPWTRYTSNGNELVSATGGTTFGSLATVSGAINAMVPVGGQALVYDTLTVQESAELTIEGELRVGPWPF